MIYLVNTRKTNILSRIKFNLISLSGNS